MASRPDPVPGYPDDRPVRMWAARTFGTHVHALTALRAQRNPPVWLLVSHIDAGSPTMTAGDARLVEPPASTPDSEWIDWALQVCAEHRIEVLWATRRAEAVAAAAGRFRAVGTNLLVPTAQALADSGSKSLVYKAAGRLGLPVPPWRMCADRYSAENALGVLREHGKENGFAAKPDIGQGGEGIVRLVPPGQTPGHGELTAQAWLDLLPNRPGPPWLVMPWLPGAEHSVDVLVSGQVRAAVVRSKDDTSRAQVCRADRELEQMSGSLIRFLGVGPLGNVQWREMGGRPALLEVNPRPSGGMYVSSLALGYDLLAAAVRIARHGQPNMSDDGGRPLAMPDGPGRVFIQVPTVVELATLLD